MWPCILTTHNLSPNLYFVNCCVHKVSWIFHSKVVVDLSTKNTTNTKPLETNMDPVNILIFITMICCTKEDIRHYNYCIIRKTHFTINLQEAMIQGKYFHRVCINSSRSRPKRIKPCRLIEGYCLSLYNPLPTLQQLWCGFRAILDPGLVSLIRNRGIRRCFKRV